MKKFYKLLTIVGLILPFLADAQTITLGAGVNTSGTGSNVGPIYRSTAGSAFDFSSHYFLYTAAELATAGITPGSTITSIAWNKANAFGTSVTNNVSIWNVYMKETGTAPSPTWSSTSFATQSTGATLVYQNLAQVIPTTIGYITLTLTTPFVYTGGNLEIGSEWNCSLFAGSPTDGGFTWKQDAVTSQVFGGSNSTATITMALQAQRPQLQMTYTPGSGCTGAPEAGITTSSSASICPSINFSLGLTGATAASGLTYQWQSSADGVSYTNIPLATNPGYSTSQMTDTYYQCVIICTGSGLQDISTPVFVTTNSFLNCYCTSNATNTADEEILNVSVGTLNNASTCGTTGGPGSIQSQYSDYTALVPAPILAASAGYSFSVQIGTCGGNFTNGVKIFIDYNQNGLFTDPGENVYTSALGTAGPHTETGSIVIPMTATVGLTKMRIVNVETATMSTINPCGTYTWGETEDYLVNIAPVPTCPQPTSLALLTADLTSATIQWTAGGSETQWQIEYGPAGFVLGTGTLLTTSSNPFTIIGLNQNSFYQAYVRGICTPGDSSYWAGSISWNTYNQDQYMEADNACPVSDFIDISATGLSYTMTTGSIVPLVLPFPLLYQGVLYTEATLGNSGAIRLGTTTGTISSFNATINATTAIGLYTLWDALQTSGTGVWSETIGTAPNRQFIVQWKKDNSVLNSNDNVNVELIIDEATMEIFYVYDDVNCGNVLYNNGLSSTIGVAGTNQDILVSYNNAAYLTNNSCAHFYYTDCPKPAAFTITYLFQDEIGFTWSAGLAAETAWTVIYGPAGFDPLTSGTTITTTMTGAVIPGLTQLTQYDVYIYADCNASLQSNGLFATFITTPYCSNPSAILNTSAVDSIFTAWTWAESSPVYPSTGFNIQYGAAGFAMYSAAGTVINADNNFTDTIANSSFLAGGVYQVYLQAVCGVDTSLYVGPFSITMPITNDTVCGAEVIMADGTVYTFNNIGATVSIGETIIAPPATGAQTTTGWINSTLNNTTWFKFIAPASGNVRVNNTAINYAGQSAVYSSTGCSDYANFTLIAANDNAIGSTSVAPNYTICGLIPGDYYYLLNDGSTATAGNYSISVTPINLEAGSFANIINVCAGDTVNLFTGITGNDQGGLWTAELASAETGITDSLFASAGLAFQVFNFEYRMTDGCAYDSIVSQVEIYQPSTAGNDGSITVCRNEPVDLLAGLSGNIDTQGNWYDPSNNLLGSSWIVSSNIPGMFNYDYITGNGVCPNDTANVLLTVNGACNYLDIQEMYFGAMSLSPNPTNGLVYISNSGSTEIFNYEVTDVDGRVIATKAAAINGTATTEVNLTGKVSGIYMIRVYNDNAMKVFRVILQ
jgi:hypothetical protein